MAPSDEALYESVVFQDYFSDLSDPRQLIKVVYPLGEVLLLSHLAVLAGAETFTDIARFGENKLDLLRRFRPFHNNLREIGCKFETETRFYITASNDRADYLAAVIRQHWAIENSLRWVMDMVFRDDECRISTGHAPANFAAVKHAAHNLMRRSRAKDAMRLKRKVAAWNDKLLLGLIAQ
jgi:predicted transposase YbfD/YdcC